MRLFKSESEGEMREGMVEGGMSLFLLSDGGEGDEGDEGDEGERVMK